jgi:hypothetical protein
VSAAPLQIGSTFRPFIDSIDGVICCPATTTTADLHSQTAPYGLRFPLILDEHRSLVDQLASSGFAPASSRFGGYCDNITGMNWKLPTGRIVRMGERVVKSTTGYDLLRFLLNSSGDFGEPVDFVLRLRPDCGTTHRFWLAGSDESIARSAAALLATCWIHWFDSVDVLMDGNNTENYKLRIVLNCPEYETAVYDEYLSSFSTRHGLTMSSESVSFPPADGCPDFMLKTTPDQVISLARQVSAGHDVICIALCYNGVVHGYLSHGPEEAGGDASTSALEAEGKISTIIDRWSEDLQVIGGEWRSRHVSSRSASEVESPWIEQLEKGFASP